MSLKHLSPIVRTSFLSMFLVPFIPMEGQAQDKAQDGARSGSFLEEVMVTARRRAEDAQSVPIAVTAFSGDALEQRGIDNFDDLKYFTPGMTSTPHSGKKNWGTPTLRGQRASEIFATYDGPVGVYFNDVVAARSVGVLGTGLYDIESVEVLKGPQGTLFGRNTTGGAVLVNTKKPGDEFGGYITAETGSRDLMDFEAAVDIPVSNALKLRLAGKRVKQDGYLTNLVNGEDLDDQDSTSFRFTAQIEPSDSFSNTFVYDYSEIDAAGSGNRLVSAVPGGVADFYVGLLGSFGVPAFASSPGLIAEMNEALSGDFWDVKNTPENFEKVKVYTVSNTTTMEIGSGLTLKNILGYRDLLNRESNDLDGVALPLIQVGFDSSVEMRQISNELQLLGTAFEDKLEWITGAYLFREWGRDVANSSAFGGAPGFNDGEVENISSSVFAQGTYALTDKLDLTLGARQTWDDRELVARSREGSGTCRITVPGTTTPLPSDLCEKRVEKSFNEPTYVVSLDYQLSDDTMVYGSFRHGYKSGGFNLRARSAEEFEPFNAELIDSYELGIKSDWSLGDVNGRLNVAAFYDDYQDIQRQKQVPSDGGVPVTLIVNAAEATMQGVELELVVAPTENLELMFTYAYIDASYDEWIDQIVDRTTLAITEVDRSDNEFANVPETQIGFALTYRLPVDESLGDISFRADYFHQDEMQTNNINESSRPAPEIAGITPDFEVINLRADWNGVMQSSVDLSAYVKNAANEEYYSGVMGIQSAFGIDVGNIAAPREYGISLNYRF